MWTRCSESSGHCPGGAHTSGPWQVGSPGPVSLPPKRMSCFSAEKIPESDSGEKGIPGLPRPQSGAGARERCREGVRL